MSEDQIDLIEFLAELWKKKRRILLLSFAVGMITFLILLLRLNMFRASAVIAPVDEANNSLAAIGTVASTFGVQIGGPSTLEDLDALFRSNDLTVRVFRKYDIWPIVFPHNFVAKKGQFRVNWIDRVLHGKRDYRDPSDWDAIRVAEHDLRVSVNEKDSTLSISFESPSAPGSAQIARYYLEEAKSRLQEEALGRAMKNKKFIEEQMAKTVDALTRGRLYALYGQEVEREMMARNREQFGFRVIDAPRIPDRKSSPKRLLWTILMSIIGAIATSIYYLVRKTVTRVPTQQA